MLRVESLTKRYGERVAVNAVSFSIAQGETVGLLGPNGAGKTTAIAMISGISRPDSGAVSLGGVSLAQDTNALKRRVGLVPQLLRQATGQQPGERLTLLLAVHDRLVEQPQPLERSFCAGSDPCRELDEY